MVLLRLSLCAAAGVAKNSSLIPSLGEDFSHLQLDEKSSRLWIAAATLLQGGLLMYNGEVSLDPQDCAWPDARSCIEDCPPDPDLRFVCKMQCESWCGKLEDASAALGQLACRPYNLLPHFNDATRAHLKTPEFKSLKRNLSALVAHHNLTGDVLLGLHHKHFDIEDGLILAEFQDFDDRQSVLRAVPESMWAGGAVVPMSFYWADTVMVPYEFVASRREHAARFGKLMSKPKFLQQFGETLRHYKLDHQYGIHLQMRNHLRVRGGRGITETPGDHPLELLVRPSVNVTLVNPVSVSGEQLLKQLHPHSNMAKDDDDDEGIFGDCSHNIACWSHNSICHKHPRSSLVSGVELLHQLNPASISGEELLKHLTPSANVAKDDEEAVLGGWVHCIGHSTCRTHGNNIGTSGTETVSDPGLAFGEKRLQQLSPESISGEELLKQLTLHSDDGDEGIFGSCKHNIECGSHTTQCHKHPKSASISGVEPLHQLNAASISGEEQLTPSSQVATDDDDDEGLLGSGTRCHGHTLCHTHTSHSTPLSTVVYEGFLGGIAGSSYTFGDEPLQQSNLASVSAEELLKQLTLSSGVAKDDDDDEGIFGDCSHNIACGSHTTGCHKHPRSALEQLTPAEHCEEPEVASAIVMWSL